MESIPIKWQDNAKILDLYLQHDYNYMDIVTLTSFPKEFAIKYKNQIIEELEAQKMVVFHYQYIKIKILL